MKKMWWLAALLALPLASAGPLEFMGGVWSKILSVGDLSFLGVSGMVPFTRILLAILCFTLFFAVLLVLPTSKDGKPRFIRQHAIVISAVLAIMSAIFLPAQAILAVGVGWATAVALILIGAPIVGLGIVLWNTPGKDESGKSKETKGTVLLKLLISLLLFWILSAMSNEAKVVGASPGSATVVGTIANFIAWALYIVSIMIIWYIIKFFFTSSEDKEKQWQEGGKSLGKWIGDRAKTQKVEEEMARRAQEVREPLSYLVEAIDDTKKMVNTLAVANPADRPAAAHKAQKHLHALRRNLRKAVRSLRRLRRKERGQDRIKFYEIFDNLHTNAGVASVLAKNINLPKSHANDAEWREAYKVINNTAGDIVGVCGKMVNVLNMFIEQSLEVAQQAAAFRLQQQAQEQQAQQSRQQQAGEEVEEQAQEQTQQPLSRGKVLKSRPTGVVRRK
ncbi:MAG TPA: hypothetical protein VJB13_04420 [Candidatus Nanoarchaeia archaeon]|nr:hypothetical protein [Candidatus Nanoarchaeia archaeon]